MVHNFFCHIVSKLAYVPTGLQSLLLVRQSHKKEVPSVFLPLIPNKLFCPPPPYCYATPFGVLARIPVSHLDILFTGMFVVLNT